MDPSSNARALLALSQEGRTDIVERLVAAGRAGMEARALSVALHEPARMLSADLVALCAEGLIEARRDAERTVYIAAFERLRDLLKGLDNLDVSQRLASVSET